MTVGLTPSGSSVTLSRSSERPERCRRRLWQKQTRVAGPLAHPLMERIYLPALPETPPDNTTCDVF